MGSASRLAGALREVAGVATYPAIGHLVRRRGWDDADLAVDLAGRVAVVTGGSSGIGLAIARGLAKLGATVVIACRDRARGEGARRAVAVAAGHDRVELEIADVSSVAEVRALASRVAARHPRVHVLVNNAAVLLYDRRRSADGVEATFATNALGGFVLTHLLLPQILAAAPARVVHVTSAAIYAQRLSADALLAREGPYDGRRTYARTKRAQVELNDLWVTRLAGTGVTTACMHPGLVATPGTAVAAPLYHRLFSPILRDPDQGADTAVWLAASPAVEGRTGELWFDRAPRPAHVVPWTRAPRAEAERLWDACAAIGGVA
jgi:NAD(P)-dependent dehydrogenase (short-subunit alcohol dehydrogenase family)